MNVDYNDERFSQVEAEKQNELNRYNNAYDNLIKERNNLTQQQQDYVDRWEQTQKDVANQNLQHQIELYNQEKAKSEKDFQREASASYADYLKESDRYGVSREQQVANGLANSGYSESSKVDMYNTYQNRLASARRSLNEATLEFDNAIKEAQLSNNATLAQNALEALKQKLGIALEDFNYRDTQTQNKLTWENNLNNQYYSRYKDVENQLNYENEQREAIRQYNEQMERQREQDRLAQQQYQDQLARQKEQDRLEQQRWEQEMEFQRQQFEYQKQLANSNSNTSSSSSNSSYGALTGSNSSSTSSNSKAIEAAAKAKSAVQNALSKAKQMAGGNNSYMSSLTKITPSIKSVPSGISKWSESQFFSSNVIKNGITIGDLESKLSDGLKNGKISKAEAERILSWYGL